MIVDDEKLSRKILTQLITLTDDLELVETCNNAVEAINILNSKRIDLLLLDIEMPDISGLQLMNSIKHLPLIIVISATKQNSVDVNVIDFIIKPISAELCKKVIKKAKDFFYKKEEIATN
jgi:YesN/AraC family two-component response regulator